jgi:hypothetical protein
MSTAMNSLSRRGKSGIVAGSTLALIGVLFFANYTGDNKATAPSMSADLAREMTREVQTTIDYHGDPACQPHGGVPINHDADEIFVKYYDKEIENLKTIFDSHLMPQIVKVEPSFYFRTINPQPVSGKNWPALSRAWNDTFVVVDDEELPDGPVWGTLETAQDAAAKWSIPSPPTDESSENLRKGGDNSEDANSSDDALRVRTLPSGNYATYSGWYVGNFGHYIHDHVSKIAWLKDQVPSDTKIILPHLSLYEEVMEVVDHDFVKSRVVWIDYDETVHAPEGSLTVVTPRKNHPFGAYPETGSIFTEHLRQWLEDSHWKKSRKMKKKKKKKSKVLYYSRAAASRRIMDPQHEEKIIDIIRSKMIEYGRKEDDLIIFSGRDEEGALLSVEDQFEMYSMADTAIGAHGSGFANIIWMDPRCNADTKVLEFASSSRSEEVQSGSYWGYYLLYGTLPWIDYHYMYYTRESTESAMYIDLAVLEETLDDMWGAGSATKSK